LASGPWLIFAVFMKYHKTTKKEFREFKRGMEAWYNKLKLHSWNITASHDDIQDGVCASIYTDTKTMSAHATFNTIVCGEAVYDGWAYDTGKHEMLHVLLARLGDIASQRWVTERELVEEEERVVLALERALN